MACHLPWRRGMGKVLPIELQRAVYRELRPSHLSRAREVLTVGIDADIASSLMSNDRWDAELWGHLDQLNNDSYDAPRGEPLRQYLLNARVYLSYLRLPELDRALRAVAASGATGLAAVTTAYSVDRGGRKLASTDAEATRRAADRLAESFLVLLVAGDQGTMLSAIHTLAGDARFRDLAKMQVDFARGMGAETILFDVLREQEPAAPPGVLLVVNTTSEHATAFMESMAECPSESLNEVLDVCRNSRRYVLIAVADPERRLELDAFKRSNLWVDLPRAECALRPPSPPLTPADEERWRWSVERDVMEKAVLFTTAYFPDVHPNDFDTVVQLFLGNTVDEPGPQNLRERWPTERSRVLARCGLRFAPAYEETQALSVCFPLPETAKAVQRAVLDQDYLYYAEAVRQVGEAGLLYVASRRVGERAAALLAEGAQRGAGALVVEQVVTKVRDASDVERGQVLNRVAWLLRVLREGARPDDMDESVVLRRLMELRCHAAVLDLARRLRSASGFDFFLWLRRLLNGSNDATRKAVRRELCERLRRDNQQARDALVLLCGWLREDEKTPAADLVAGLIVDLCERSILKPTGAGGELSSRLVVGAAKQDLAEVLQAFLAATESAPADKVIKNRLNTHVHVLVHFWLLPPELGALLPRDGEGLAVELFKLLGDAKKKAPNGKDGKGLFQALCWADWMTRAESEAGSEAADALIQRLDAVDAERGVLRVYWHMMETGLSRSLIALGEVRASDPVARLSRRAARDTLEGRRRAVRVLRERLTSTK